MNDRPTPLGYTPEPFPVPIWPAGAIVRRSRSPSLTPEQRELYEYVVAFRARHPYGPTFREIAAALGIPKMTAYGRARRLVALRVLTLDKGGARSLRLAA